MTNSDYITLILGMGLVTYLPRWFPLFFLSRRHLPAVVEDWLELIPAAILSALLFPILVTAGEPRHLAMFQSELLVGIPTFLFAWKTRSLGGTVMVGMVLFWLAGQL